MIRQSEYNLPSPSKTNEIPMQCPEHQDKQILFICENLECPNHFFCRECTLIKKPHIKQHLPYICKQEDFARSVNKPTYERIKELFGFVGEVTENTTAQQITYQDNEIVKQRIHELIKEVENTFIQLLHKFENDLINFVSQLPWNNLNLLEKMVACSSYKKVVDFMISLTQDNSEIEFDDIKELLRNLQNIEFMRRSALIIPKLEKMFKSLNFNINDFMSKNLNIVQKNMQNNIQGNSSDIIPLHTFNNINGNNHIQNLDTNQQQSNSTVQIIPEKIKIEWWPLCDTNNSLVSLDPDLIASGNVDNTIKIYNTRTSRQVSTLLGHEDIISSLCTIDPTSILASGSFDGTARIWNFKSGECLRILNDEGNAIKAITYISSDNQLATGGSDTHVKIWDLNTGKLIRSLGQHDDWVLGLCYIKGISQLVSGGVDGIIKVWSPDKQQSLQYSIKAHNDDINCLEVNESTQQIYSGGNDGHIRIWSYIDGQQVGQLQQQQITQAGITCIVLVPPSDFLVCGDTDHFIRVYNTLNYQLIHSLSTHQNSILSLVYTGNSNEVISGSFDSSLKIWNIQDGIELGTLYSDNIQLRCVCVIPYTRLIAVAGDDTSVKLFDHKTGDLITTLTGHTDIVVTLCNIDNNKNQLVSGSYDSTIIIWDYLQRIQIMKLEGHSDWVRTIIYMSGTDYILSGGYDQTVRVWNNITGNCEGIYKAHKGGVQALCSLDNDIFSSGGDDKLIRIWSLHQKKQIATLSKHTQSIKALCNLPETGNFASGSDDHQIIVWSWSSKQPLMTFQGHTKCVRTLATIPNTHYLLSGSYDNTIQVWNYVKGQAEGSFAAHINCVLCLSPIPEESLVASCGYEGPIKIWDFKTQQLVKEIYGDLKALGINSSKSHKTQQGKPILWSFNHNMICKANIQLDPTQVLVVQGRDFVINSKTLKSQH